MSKNLKRGRKSTLSRFALADAKNGKLPSNLFRCHKCNVVQGTWRRCKEHMVECFAWKKGGRISEAECNVKRTGHTYLCPACKERFEKAEHCVTHIAGCSPDTLQGCSWPNPFNGKNPESQVDDAEQAQRLRRALTGVGKITTRSKDMAFSSDGAEGIVKIVAGGLRCPQETGGVGVQYRNKCKFAVDPYHLFYLRCVDCHQRLDMSHAKGEYLWCRRRTRKILGLLSVSMPLDGPSFWTLDSAARSCGILSNTTVAHLTFCEGYVLPTPHEDYTTWFGQALVALEALRTALTTEPFVTITSIHTVPRSSDLETVLIVADVSVSYGSAMAAQALRSSRTCSLPQFPLHVAIGACPATKAQDVTALAFERFVFGGLTLQVDPRRLSVLAPTFDEKLVRKSHSEAKHMKQPKENKELKDALGVATSIAGQLNCALSDSLHRFESTEM